MSIPGFINKKYLLFQCSLLNFESLDISHILKTSIDSKTNNKIFKNLDFDLFTLSKFKLYYLIVDCKLYNYYILFYINNNFDIINIAASINKLKIDKIIYSI